VKFWLRLLAAYQLARQLERIEAARDPEIPASFTAPPHTPADFHAAPRREQ
jgi:hypothetical protein